MAIYFQHVGEAGGRRDFPKTIGNEKSGLIRFSFDDIEDYLSHLEPRELQDIKEKVSSSAADGFQIWGIPSGAKNILRSFGYGDYLLLLETIGPGGTFAYAGRAIAVPSGENFRLSRFLWGEERFPLIVLMKGGLTNFSWHDFCDEFDYKRHWNPAGKTYHLRPDKFLKSSFEDEEAVVSALIGRSIPMLGDNRADGEADFGLLDISEIDIEDEEGRKLLRTHIIRERSSFLVRKFKRSLVNFACCICDFDFRNAYGEIGEGFIEAHHTKPISELAPGEKVNVKDLIPVCSNCHRMLHRSSPPVSWRKLRERVNSRGAK